MTTIAAIDIGYRNTKYVCQANTREPVRSHHFPSTAVKAEANPAIGDALAQRDTRLVEVDGMAYEVGPDARLLLGPRSTQVLHENFIDTPEYRALFLGALSYMGLSEIDVLVGGLTVRHMAAGKAALEAFMQGEHSVPGLGTVTIHRASVVPQPVGVWCITFVIPLQVLGAMMCSCWSIPDSSRWTGPAPKDSSTCPRSLKVLRPGSPAG